ncbi:MAG: hypothetical protein DMF61_09490 [Blastocatellia bacterium AA13]|nr:MAG: hypothetical protein DMF61_09490 [Blastocatellia bacterium AA13]
MNDASFKMPSPKRRSLSASMDIFRDDSETEVQPGDRPPPILIVRIFFGYISGRFSLVSTTQPN